LNRFIRDYELIITLTSNEVVKIIPEIRIQFEVNKSIYGGLNSCKIKIYNLSEDKRMKLVKDKEDNTILMPFLFKAGYNKLETLFKGNVWEAYSVKQGADFVTFISSLDGGYDFVNSFTSKTVKNDNYIDYIINDMPNTNKGRITNKKRLVRPKVLVGNSCKLDDFIPLVNARTGLLETPVKKNQEVTFKTLLNPSLKIGGLVELESIGAKHLNGVYKIVTIKYSGDNYGSDWTQEVTCHSVNNYKVIK